MAAQDNGQEEKKVARRVAPTSLLFDYTVLSAFDDVDKAWTPMYAEISSTVEAKGSHEVKQLLVEQVVQDKSRIVTVVCGLLYGILAKPQYAATCYGALAFVSMSRYAYGVACDNLHHVVLHRFPELLPSARAQLIWVIGALMRDNVREVEPLAVVLLRWVAGGDRSRANVALADAVVDILVSNRDYVFQRRELLRHSVYACLRLILDHEQHRKLRDKEAAFCADALKEKTVDLLGMGRDIVRAIKEVAHIPQIHEAWSQIVSNPKALAPAFDGIGGVLAVETRKSYLRNRVTPRLEQWLHFLLTKANGRYELYYMAWLNTRYFASPESAETLVTDAIRFICRCVQPTPEQTAHGVVPRWRPVAHLLMLIKTQQALESAKAALFYDWLFYGGKEQLSSVEPGAMLIQAYMEKHGGKLSCSLLELLVQAPATWQSLVTPQVIINGVSAAFAACFEVSILRSAPRVIDNTTILGVDLSGKLKATFPTLFASTKAAKPKKKLAQPSKEDNAEELARAKTPPPGSRSPQPHSGEGMEQRLVKKLMREGWGLVPARKAVHYSGADAAASRNWLVEHMDDPDFHEPLPETMSDASLNVEKQPETHNQQESASDGAEGSKDGDEGDGWVEEEVLEEHVHPETGVVKRALLEEPANGPKRLRAESDSVNGHKLMGDIDDLQQRLSTGGIQSQADADRAVALLADILRRLREDEACSNHTMALAVAVAPAAQGAPWLWASPDDSPEAAAALGGTPARLFHMFDLLYSGDEEETTDSDGRAWFLHGLYAQGVEDIGTCLLAFVVARRIGVAPYLGFCQTFGDELSIPHCIARDAQGCSDYEVQCSIMLYVFRQLKWLAGDTSLLTIMMSAMDGRHLYEARCLITQGLVRFFRVDTLAELLEHSLHWEALEVHNLYQLLHATALHAPDDVSGALVTALPLMHPAEHAEAMSGFLLLLSALPPSMPLVSAVIACPPAIESFAVCALLQWAAVASVSLAGAVSAAIHTLGPAERERARKILTQVMQSPRNEEHSLPDALQAAITATMEDT